MSKTALPGVNLLGYSYDVQGYYADIRSIKTTQPLFNFLGKQFDPDNGSHKKVTIYGKDFYLPDTAVYSYLLWQDYQLDNSTIMSTKEFQIKVNSEVSAKGFYNGFSGSFKANFGASYGSSDSFYNLTQRGLIKAYNLNLGSINSLRESLTTEARADINSMDPGELVKKWGTHFLYGGIFGGALDFSQSISKYSVSSQANAESEVTANYLGLAGGSVSLNTDLREMHSESQSSAHYEARGGNPDAITKGWDEWSETVRNGNFTLVGFKDSEALRPISVLADSSSRAMAIDEAIKTHLSSTPPDLQSLKWDKSKKRTIQTLKSDTPEVHIKVGSEDEVIVGFAGKIKSHNVTRIAIKTLNLNDNSMRWIVAGDVTTYNATDYEANIDLSAINRGVAVTGIAVSDHHDNLEHLALYYQALNPADNNARPNYLGDKLEVEFGGIDGHSVWPDVKKYEASFVPDPAESQVIVGIGIRASSGDKITVFNIDVAPLLRTTD